RPRLPRARLVRERDFRRCRRKQRVSRIGDADEAEGVAVGVVHVVARLSTRACRYGELRTGVADYPIALGGRTRGWNRVAGNRTIHIARGDRRRARGGRL